LTAQPRIDRATYENPHQFSAGISHVLVNGRLVVDAGQHTGVRSGVALKGPGSTSSP
jgi:N-acyl-D-amino-acid deacylase